MKNLAKIFMAVVALFAFACTTDTTYDPTVELGAGQTTVTLSLDDENDTVESRTHITGEKNADNKYLLYWSNGDQIALNGVASNKLEIAEGVHTKTATFTVEGGEQARPWNIVYPAPAEGVTKETEGCYPVTFLAEQSYTANTFAEGSTPMYAYVNESGESEGLQHLAGVLRFDVKAPAQTTTEGETSTETTTDGTTETKTVTLKTMVVEVAEGKIAGNFDVNCATGEVTPHADATNTVTVSFPGDGLKLVADATPIYVALPAGEYGTITIYLYTNEGFMRGTFSIDNGQEVKPGVILEFGEVTYLSKTEAGTFFIYDEASLREFAANVTADPTTAVTAKVVADITLTDAWESINGFAGTFDGGNHTISGLNKPLFGTTQAAEIKNIHLANVNIPSASMKDEVSAGYAIGSATIRANGALARIIDNTSAVVNNCSADGMITINLDTDDYFGDPATPYHFASLVGYSTSTQEFSNLTSFIELSVVDEDGAHNTVRYVAGIVSYHAGSLNAAKHLGKVKYDVGTGKQGETFVAGIVYQCLGTMSNCENGDSLDTTRETGSIYVGNGGKYFKTSSAVIGGLAVYLPTSLNNCHNYANITVSTVYYSSTYNLVLGGLAAQCTTTENKTITNCSNHGDITIAHKTLYYKSYYIGGLVGKIDTGTNTITNCHNTGNIHYNASESSYTTADTSYAGGLVGYVASSTNFESCSNGGNITIDNKMADGKSLYVGGIVGASTAGTINSTNAFCDINVSLTTAIAGMITGSAYAADKVTNCNVGGSILKGVGTEAVALSRSNYPAYIYGSGVEGDGTEEVVVNTNKCGWLASKDATNGIYKVFGAYIISDAAGLIYWAANEAATSTDIVELGADIDLSAEGIDWTPFGAEANGWKSIEGFKGTFDGKEFEIKGLTAPLFGTTQAGTIKNVKLTGVVINETENPVIGALARQISNTSAVVSDCSASGSLSVDYSGSTRPNIAGLIGKSTSTQTFTGLKNEVNITALSDAEYGDGANHAGIICEFAGCLEDSQNLGTITVNTKTEAEDNTHVVIAGIANYCSKGVINCTNGEDTKVTEDKGKKGALAYGSITRGHIWIGGIISGTVEINNVSKVTGCKNYGNVEFTGSSLGKRPIRLSGVVALLSRVTEEVSGCENHGNMTLSAIHDPSDKTPESMISGIANADSGTAVVKDCKNYGNMIVTEKANLKYDLYIGGLISMMRYDGAGENLYNYGQISVKGATVRAIYAGGVAGYVTGSLKNNTVNDNGHITIDTPNVGDMANTRIGGIVGKTTSTIEGARCYCTITAYPSDTSATEEDSFTSAGIGMITGSAYAETNRVTDSHIGGKIDQGYYSTGLKTWQSAATNITVSAVEGEIMYYVYNNYIYGGNTDIKTVVNDGCGVLLKSVNDAPEIPKL